MVNVPAQIQPEWIPDAQMLINRLVTITTCEYYDSWNDDINAVAYNTPAVLVEWTGDPYKVMEIQDVLNATFTNVGKRWTFLGYSVNDTGGIGIFLMR